eukprot:gene148-156_t
MSKAVSDKLAARSKNYDLVVEEGQRKSMLNAYKLKSQILHEEREKAKQDTNPHYMIRTMSRVVIPPQKKFEHCPGALISPFPLDKTLELHASKMLKKSASESPYASPAASPTRGKE